MMIDLQALMDGMSAQWQKDRAGSQMTLGDLISALESLPEGSEVDGIGKPHSYRGYYEDLAFQRIRDKRKASEVLSDAKAAMGEVFQGYKGGDYMMGKQTPIWVAAYGCCGEKIMEINPDGSFSLEDDE
jgi:hypothetical protein